MECKQGDMSLLALNITIIRSFYGVYFIGEWVVLWKNIEPRTNSTYCQKIPNHCVSDTWRHYRCYLLLFCSRWSTFANLKPIDTPLLANAVFVHLNSQNSYVTPLPPKTLPKFFLHNAQMPNGWSSKNLKHLHENVIIFLPFFLMLFSCCDVQVKLPADMILSI